ncbi:MAG: prolyl oligopeptidase family serine peptidase [Nitrososphaeria archaeon]
MKILVLHGKGSSPKKIEWLASPLRAFGEVDAPEADIEAEEFIQRFMSKNYDLVAGHSRGGTFALLYAAYRGVPVIAVSAPSDRMKQRDYLSRFSEGTIQRKLYEDLSGLSKEYLQSTSPIFLAEKIKDALLIHGSEDSIVPVEQSIEMCKLINEKGGRCFLSIVKMKHTPSIANYKEISSIIQEWVRRHVV